MRPFYHMIARSAPILTAVALGHPLAHAGPADASGDVLQGGAKSPISLPQSQQPWSFGTGYAPWFNLRASFSDLGGLPAARPFPAPGAAVREYDDGFVRPDISGSPTTTTNWSYQNASQYDPAGGGSLTFSITDVPGSASARETDDALAGFEMFASRDMGTFQLGGQPVNWGLIARMNYARIDIRSDSTLNLDGRRMTDTFPLNGVVPPLAPYTGSFTGPGPLLGTTPVQDTLLIPGGATISGFRELEANLFAISAGPWISFTPFEKFHLQLEAGVTLSAIDGDYRQRSTTAFGGATATSTSRGGNRDVLPGFYAGGTASYDFSRQWSGFAGLRYQYLDDYEVNAGGSKASLSFSQSFIGVIGVRFRF
ncbi:MAG: hypothetical protein EOP87_08800 [Verrucomicrobiaceae bacterium]|nr:MAG: hypothetical protein EOP87_08800 [Verrucomicrobiaceae bacterium]